MGLRVLKGTTSFEALARTYKLPGYRPAKRTATGHLVSCGQVEARPAAARADSCVNSPLLSLVGGDLITQRRIAD